jgi:hypothetical protein
VAVLLLLPSPLLGPAAWAPVADLLGARVADPVGATTPEDVLAAYVAAADGLAEVLLVPHSNAGLYAPLVAERIDALATVYVDAALPGTAASTPLAPAAFLDFLTGLAGEDGLLPPWTQWWDDLGDLFPDEEARARVEAAQPRLPLAYFTSRLDVPAGWAGRPSAYLAFGDTYADEIAFARARGWPVTALPGRHLHQLVAPADVAAAITRMVQSVRVAGP